MTDVRVRSSELPHDLPDAQVLIREAHAHRRQRLRWTGLVVAVLVVAAVLATLGAARSSPPSAAGGSQGQPVATDYLASRHEPAGWHVSYPFALPTTFPFIEGFTASRTNGSVWIFAARDSRRVATALFEWTPQTRRLTQYALNAPVYVLSWPAAAMVVAPDGNVWVGFHSRLVDFDPRTGVTRVVAMPAVRHGVSADTATDPDNAAAGIVSLAVAGNGTIVVGRSYATAVAVVNPRTLAVSSIPLPPNTVLGQESGNFSSLSVDQGDADIAAVLNAQPDGHQSTIHALGQYVDGRWTESDAHCQAWGATFTGEQLVVTDIDACLAVGTYVPGHGPVALTYPPYPDLKNYPQALALRDGTVVAVTPHGLRAIVHGRQTPNINLGSILYYYDYPVPAGTRLPKSPQRAGISPRLMAWGGDNTIWFVSQDFNRVGVLTQSGPPRVSGGAA